MLNNKKDEIKAGFFVRFAAYCVDMFLVSIALCFIKLPLWVATLFNPDALIARDFIFEYSIKDILFYCLQAAYFIIMTYKTGATAGKMLFRIKVVREDGEPLKLFDVVYRETVGRFLSALILNIGYLIAGFSDDKKGLHDILSDTRVVYALSSEKPIAKKINKAVNQENSEWEQLSFEI